jgi:predicted enzyme related to lactoylglutathione lyase
VEYPLLSAAGTTFGGVAQADLPNGPAHWRVYFEVEDVAAALEKAVELGATPIGQQESAAGVGRWAALLDPQGALFALLEPEPQSEEQSQPESQAQEQSEEQEQDDAASTET